MPTRISDEKSIRTAVLIHSKRIVFSASFRQSNSNATRKRNNNLRAYRRVSSIDVRLRNDSNVVLVGDDSDHSDVIKYNPVQRVLRNAVIICIRHLFVVYWRSNVSLCKDHIATVGSIDTLCRA